MHDLIAITPMGATDARIDTIKGMKIAERPDFALASVAARAGRETDTVDAAKTGLGLDLPPAGRFVTHAPYAAFWTGPEQWLIEAPHDSHENLADLVKAALGDAASVTEQTDGWVRFDLEGAECHAVLELLCNADTRRMKAGDATRTQLEHMACFVACRTQDMRFSVTGARSSAASLHHALVTAAQSAL